MRSILIIWAWKWLGTSLLKEKHNFHNIYTVSRTISTEIPGVTHIVWDVTKDLDFSKIEKLSLDIVVYIPSLWGTSSEISCKEFDEYMDVWPRWLLNCFHTLKRWEYCNMDCLFVSIGSTASETALNLWKNPSSSIYSMSKLAQKSALIWLSHLYKQYRYLNITLGSIWVEGDTDGVWYENIYSSIKYVSSMNTWVRYTEIQLVSRLDM